MNGEMMITKFLKLTLIGDCRVGKSCLISQYMYNDFEEDYLPTESGYYKRTETFNNDRINADIIDTAGKYESQADREGYLKTCDGFLLVFDLTNRESFHAVKAHREEVLRCNAESISRDADSQYKQLPLLLIGNKSDLTAARKVSEDEGQSLAKVWNVPYLETSAKTGQNVQKAFTDLFTQINQVKYCSAAQSQSPKQSDDETTTTTAGTTKRKILFKTDSGDDQQPIRIRISAYFQSMKNCCSL